MTSKKLVNFLLFVAGWWTALLFGNAPALIALFTVLMLHFVLWRDVRDIFLVLSFIFIGFGIEWAFMAADVHHYRTNLPPAWSICIWAMLATVVRHFLSPVIKRPFFAAILSAVAAPAFYCNSVYFAPLDWGRPVWQCLLVIALVWSLLAAFISGVLVPLLESDTRGRQSVPESQ
ncbi:MULTISPECIES: DUF2878 domain-containing protein [Microbulbifer]|uniref:DUF2878 domain-containing protein n=1 Tax=Microbulbifer celer TaxID=435905 RepID=A0ABW3U2S3_9GAMM|nr:MULTISPECIES: DUF2878 domain-containing protein [Microbulbifer]UFN56123.1 DUF2878 domain-containing protein [Microbulbifer celer]